MQNFRKQLADAYFGIDTRSLGAFRITLAIALLIDLALRARVLDAFYTNTGLLPNHTLLWSPPGPRMYSLFFGASKAVEAGVLMGACGVVFGMLALGLHTKWAQALSLLAVVSLNTRIAPLENGGDIVLNWLCIWSLFLPLGERFSIDAIRASLRRVEQQAPAQLNDRALVRVPPRRVYSLACFALFLQFFAIYALNALQKDGQTWLSGDAVHYALHQDRIVKLPGVWLREHAPVELLRGLTWATIAMEGLAAILIIFPFATKYTRLAALAIFPAMHVAFDACIDVGVFSIAMIAFYPLLIDPSHWDWLHRRARRWHQQRVVFVDDDCGFCMMCARLLARLDVLERVEFASNGDEGRLPAGITLAQADESITTVDRDSGRVHRGAAAIAAPLRSVPFGFVPAIFLQAPVLRSIAEWVYMRVARNRISISLWLGFNACGLPLPAAGGAGLVVDEPPPARLLWLRVRRGFGEACVALLLVAASSEVVNANEAFPAALRHAQPQFLTALLHYPRAFQTWHMFAPHAPLGDSMIEVDALTAGGRRVDPFNELASRVPGPGYTSIPPRLNQNQFYCGYALFVWQPHFRPYWTAFQEWILRYPERTGRAEDRIVRYTVSILTDVSPPPGATKASEFKRQEFLRYP